MTVMQRIEELNAERGWSLYELSKQTKISESTIYTWNRNGKTPSIPVLEKICVAYGITLFQFFQSLENTTLTDEQNNLITKWSILDKEEKNAIYGLLELFIKRK